ncbi:hypothetical protein [Streptosporangium longisporum]|uniref:Histidine kinase n=1 Tax=Streptosporangium longisporum TaxID=46187 RepID=A0ABN3XS01_9ACTN
MPTPRKLTLLAAIVGPLVLITLAVLAITGIVSVTAALVLGALATVLAVQLLMILTVRRLDGKALRIDARVKRHEAETATVKTVAERLDRRLDEITALIEKHENRRDEDLQAILVSLGEDRLAFAPGRRQIEETVRDLLSHPAGTTRGQAEHAPAVHGRAAHGPVPSREGTGRVLSEREA